MARARLRGEEPAAPELVDLEVTSALRGLLCVGKIDERRAAKRSRTSVIFRFAEQLIANF